MGKRSNILSNEITPENVYLSRRNFIRTGLFAGSVLATGTAYRLFSPGNIEKIQVSETVTTSKKVFPPTPEGEAVNTFEQITNYNNFYEFSTSKTAVAAKAQKLKTRPWTLEVGGLVMKPKVFDIEELLRFDQEDRVYRFRCVEAWSMVIPWLGFPLKKILDRVEPLSSAGHVAFESFYDQDFMQSPFSAGIRFPYVEGLRLDEAMHPLTILGTGLYGRSMPKQNGAPIRLVVPWKYGFKSIKSVVKITLTADEPATTWNLAAPGEYGFYSNVNPDVDHPRWSQGSERRIGEIAMRKTLPFNGYADQVADLYRGMDLRKFF